MDMVQLRQLAPEIKKIAHKHGILNLQVFGSVARGNATPKSDVDFLVEMKEGASLFGVAGFSYEAEQLLGVPVDVIPVSLLPEVEDPDFVRNIQRDAIAI